MPFLDNNSTSLLLDNLAILLVTAIALFFSLAILASYGMRHISGQIAILITFPALIDGLISTDLIKALPADTKNFILIAFSILAILYAIYTRFFPHRHEKQYSGIILFNLTVYAAIINLTFYHYEPKNQYYFMIVVAVLIVIKLVFPNSFTHYAYKKSIISQMCLNKENVANKYCEKFLAPGRSNKFNWIINFSLYENGHHSPLSLCSDGSINCTDEKFKNSKEEFLKSLSIIDVVAISGAAADTSKMDSPLSFAGFVTSGTGTWLPFIEGAINKLHCAFLGFFGASIEVAQRITDGGFTDNLGIFWPILKASQNNEELEIICLDNSYDKEFKFSDLYSTKKMLSQEGIEINLQPLEKLKQDVKSGKNNIITFDLLRNNNANLEEKENIGKLVYVKLYLPQEFANALGIKKIPKCFPHITTTDQQLTRDELDLLFTLGEEYAEKVKPHLKQ